VGQHPLVSAGVEGGGHRGPLPADSHLPGCPPPSGTMPACVGTRSWYSIFWPMVRMEWVRPGVVCVLCELRDLHTHLQTPRAPLNTPHPVSKHASLHFQACALACPFPRPRAATQVSIGPLPGPVSLWAVELRASSLVSQLLSCPTCSPFSILQPGDGFKCSIKGRSEPFSL
jgi:hypothetical protein